MSCTQPTGFIGAAFLVISLQSCISTTNTNTNTAETPMIPPAFTVAQADAGNLAYDRSCTACHGNSLEGAGIVPALVGRRFDQSWRGKPLTALSFHLRRMPPADVPGAGALDDETYTNILAHILLANGFVPGDAALPSEITAQDKFTITPQEGVDYDPLAPVDKTAAQAALLASLSDVTDAMLRDPPQSDWLHWGRTYAGQSHSKLKQINRRNVQRLRPAWRAPLVNGTSMPMPLVHGGVMFLQTWPDTVLAMDASTGKVLWRYQRQGDFRPSKKMGVSLHENRVYVATSDMHVIALDLRSGEVVWDHELALESQEVPAGASEFEQLIFSGQQYHTRNAPLIAGKVVIQGTMAYRVPKGSYIIAIDRETGLEAWRFNTIAWPGQPGGDTWNGIPVEARNGGSVWQQGTYDPETNLVYFGIAPTYDTAPLLNSSGVEGHTNEGMYTNCTVALDADTGKLVWYFQHTQNDQWDLDWAFERILADLPTDDGGTVRAVMNVGKISILDALDAATGRFLFSVDTGLQNFITAVDPVTGAKTIDPAKLPNPDNPIVICPHIFGSRAWPQTSYSPDTGYLYVPIVESCVEMSATDQGGFLLTTGVNFAATEHPGLADGMMGRLQAIDLRTRRLAWNRNQLTPPTTGMLTTSGGLLFAGDIDPSLNAFDDSTGELLWEIPLDDLPSSSVITYQVGDTQYVAVVVGMMNNWIRDTTRYYRQWSDTEGTPGDEGGGAVWAFSLSPQRLQSP